MKAAHDIVQFEGFKIDKNKAMKPVMIASTCTYEFVCQVHLKFNNFLPDPASDLQAAFTMLKW